MLPHPTCMLSTASDILVKRDNLVVDTSPTTTRDTTRLPSIRSCPPFPVVLSLPCASPIRIIPDIVRPEANTCLANRFPVNCRPITCIAAGVGASDQDCPPAPASVVIAPGEEPIIVPRPRCDGVDAASERRRARGNVSPVVVSAVIDKPALEELRAHPKSGTLSLR